MHIVIFMHAWLLQLTFVYQIVCIIRDQTHQVNIGLTDCKLKTEGVPEVTPKHLTAPQWCDLPAHISLTSIPLQLIGKLEEKCNLLPLSHKKALSADSAEIMYTTPGDVGIYYDDDGQNLFLFTSRNHFKSEGWWCFSASSCHCPNISN